MTGTKLCIEVGWLLSFYVCTSDGSGTRSDEKQEFKASNAVLLWKKKSKYTKNLAKIKKCLLKRA